MASHFYRALKTIEVKMGNGSMRTFTVGQLIAISTQAEANRMIAEGLVQPFEFTRPSIPKAPSVQTPHPRGAPAKRWTDGRAKLLVKFPTRARAAKFFEVLDRYRTLLSGKYDVRFIVSCDADDSVMNCDKVKARFRGISNLVCFYGENPTKVAAVNADLDTDMDFDILLLASDDMIPAVDGYDDVIVRSMQGYYPDLDGVLWFNDGYVGEKLNTLCILGKRYYDRFGYIYHPSYKSVWCDNEFTDVARTLGRQTYIKDVIIRHEHPTWNPAVKKDAVYDRNEADHAEDRKNYETRKLLNFP